MAWRQALVPRWIDNAGLTCTQTFYTAANPAPVPGSAAAIITSMQAASHAGLYYYKLCPIAVVGEAAEGGDYPSVTDRLQLLFRSTAGTVGKVNIVAPLTSLFLPGGERPDFDNPTLAAVVSAFTGFASDSYGNAWETCYSGKRMKIRIPSPY